jgi:alpha-L-fucosidase
MIQRFRFYDARDWFLQKRFGMFIHWGLYAIPAWQEQVIWRGHMPRKDYEPLMYQFNPVKFDPEQWLDRMQEAGMEYVCFTTKHHDGFCMWDTAYTDYKVTNSPYGKDIVGMLAEACHKRKVPFGVYYSIPDWHHKNYPAQGRHHEMFGQRAGDEPDFDLYVEYMENQVRELMTGYGEISQLFWDINVIEYDNTAFNDEIRRLQPSIVINDRGPRNGDFKTPERHLPDGMEFPVRTEAVQSMGRESWGYRADEDYYSHKYLMQSIDRSMAMGGNYQLNVGPRADGSFDPKDLESMRIIGNWFHRVKESLVGTVPATSIITQATDNMRDEIMLTRSGNTIYVHAYKDIQCSAVILKPLAVMPKRAVLLNDGRELEAKVELIPSHHRERPYLRIREIPVNEFVGEPIVIRLDFDESVNA